MHQVLLFHQSLPLASSFITNSLSPNRCRPRHPAHYLHHHVSCHSATPPSNEPPSSSSASPLDNQSEHPPQSQSQPTNPPPNPQQQPSTDDLLAAFDAALDGMTHDKSTSTHLDPTVLTRRQAQKEKAYNAHLRRLEVLTSLPEELVVRPARNTCPGCGAELQQVSANRPGYLPPDRSTPARNPVTDNDDSTDNSTDNDSDDAPAPVCQRCYRLTHYGAIAPNLRVSTRPVPVSSSSSVTSVASATTAKPSSSTNSVVPEDTTPGAGGELTPDRFRRCLQQLRGLNAVIVYLVDIFDFHGSLIPSLRDLIGSRNPVILAVNKTDLLPDNFKPDRVQTWVKHESSALGIRDIVGVHLISSKRGTGLRELLAEAVKVAKSRKADIYVVGAANVGKSSFINQLMRLRKRDVNGQRNRGEKNRGKQDKVNTALTTSVIPGTTLDVIKIPLGPNISLFDTPGLMIPHQITNILDSNDLSMVVPAKSVVCTTFRLGEGKSLFIGGLARLEIISGRPFFFSCFFSSEIKLHPGKSENSDEFVRKHIGKMLTPPLTEEGYERLGEWTSKTFTTEGAGWKKSSVDVVLSGLGWIGVTGAGSITVRMWVPKEVGVFTRDPLMPFEVQAGVSAYTGSKSINRRQMRKRRDVAA